jgi:hypothetical protein
MRVEIDQSGKFEWTQKPTILALANGLCYTVLISASEKRIIQRELRRRKPAWSKTLARVYVFSILLYLLLRDHITKLSQVIIDTEYAGYEPVIKDRVLTLCRRRGINVFTDQLAFRRIGKKSPAHEAAIAIFRGKAKPDRQIDAAEVLAEI